MQIQIPGYKILLEIGRGGMSTVYLAVQESLERQVALKVMSHGLASNEAFKNRFLNEGRIVAHLNHRNIVTIYDIGVVNDVYFIAMEYVVGRNLSERIAEGLTQRQSVKIVRRIARASIMPTPGALSIATSSHRISCFETTETQCSPTSASPSPCTMPAVD